MQLPVDFKALVDEMTNIDSARKTKISVSVYLDNKAPGDLVAHVRGLFASTSPTVRMTITYLDSSFTPHAGDDMAIVVAGASRSTGAAAAALRATDVPAAVVTTQPATVGRLAAESGYPVPEGDLIAPCDKEDADVAAVEPFELTDDIAEALNERLGRWIVSVCHEKRLAFSIAFPFLRRPLAIDAVQATSLQNAGIGLVPMIPGADLPILTLNQAKMVLQIAAAYGQEMGKDRAKEMAAVVGGAYLCRTLARELVEFVPVLGFVIRTGIAYGGTAAIGHAVIEYFEGGRDVTGVANVASKATKTATHVVQDLRNDPKAVASNLRSKVAKGIPAVRGKVEKYVPIARNMVSEYAPMIRDAATEYAPAIKQAAIDTVRAATSRS